MGRILWRGGLSSSLGSQAGGQEPERAGPVSQGDGEVTRGPCAGRAGEVEARVIFQARVSLCLKVVVSTGSEVHCAERMAVVVEE